MVICRFYFFSLFAVLGLLFQISANEINSSGLQSIFGSASARASIYEQAPILDGNLQDPVWQSLQEEPLYYADERVDGSPANLAWVKFLVANESLYVGMYGHGKVTTMRPMGVDLPEEMSDALIGRLPTVERKPSLPFIYRHLYGSVVKFGPSGGSVTPDKKGDIDWGVYGTGNIRCRSEGILWSHFGMSPVRYRNVEHIPCTCESTHFDTDAFGRTFLPDALRYQVEVIDANGNPMLRFGRYGNMDDDTLKSGDPSQPAMAWPVVIDVREKDIYIADRLNKRIIKVNLKGQVQAKLNISL